MKKEETRRKILEGAYQCFSHRGYHEVRIAEIATAAGVGKGTVYEYFSSKKELYNQLFVFMGEIYLEEILRQVETGTGVEEKLERLYLTHARFHQRLMQSAQGSLLLEELMSTRGQKDLYPIRQKMQELTTDILRQGKKEGLLTEDLDEKMGAFFLMMGLPCIVYADDLKNIEENVRILIRLTLNGLQSR